MSTCYIIAYDEIEGGRRGGRKEKGGEEGRKEGEGRGGEKEGRRGGGEEGRRGGGECLPAILLHMMRFLSCFFFLFAFTKSASNQRLEPRKA